MRPRSSRAPALLAVGLVAAFAGADWSVAGAPPPTRFDASVASAFDGVSIHYAVDGAGTPTIILIHCWMCDSSFWDSTVPALAGSYRVVTLDLPGHGASGKNRQVWSMAAFGRDVVTVADALRLHTVILVGHSMGGEVMLEAARLLRGRVVGMIAVDTLHDADEKANPKEIEDFLAKMRADFPGQTRRLVRAIAGKSADPAVVERIAAKMSSGDASIGIALMDALQHYDEKAGMSAAGAPMVGINSTMFPTNVEANRKVLPRFELLPLPDGVGHFPQLEAPETFDRLLERAIRLLVQQSR
jgi:pimeloyl-ACP methyl ester carboxylesterase